MIPQLIARIDSPRRLVSKLIHTLLTDVGKQHPQVIETIDLFILYYPERWRRVIAFYLHVCLFVCLHISLNIIIDFSIFHSKSMLVEGLPANLVSVSASFAAKHF